jgi:hypothetical protein
MSLRSVAATSPLAAIRYPITVGNCWRRRLPPSMRRLAGAARVVLYPPPGHGGRHERWCDGQMIHLIVCSICLRVLRGSEWLDAEHVIRDTRSYDEGLPRLLDAVCDECIEAVSRRRAAGEEAAEAVAVVDAVAA